MSTTAARSTARKPAFERSVAGLAVMAYGLVRLDLLTVVSGVALAQTAKAWLLDRMALLFEDMKARDPAWER
jgi:hypothetical protein